MVGPERVAVGGDIVSEILALAHGVAQVEVIVRGFARPAEAVQHPQTLRQIQLGAFGAEPGKVRLQVGGRAPEVLSCLFRGLLLDGQRDIFVLHNRVGAVRKAGQHVVDFTPVFVLAVAPVFGQHDVVQFGVVDLPVDDGDLAGHAVFQGVEDLAVFEELVLLVLPAGNGIVDVSELKCL